MRWRRRTVTTSWHRSATTARRTVDMAAPGVGILSTELERRVRHRNGTSMAAPHVTGTAALVWARTPYATQAQVREAIFQGVDPLGRTGRASGHRRTLERLRRAHRGHRAAAGRDDTDPGPHRTRWGVSRHHGHLHRRVCGGRVERGWERPADHAAERRGGVYGRAAFDQQSDQRQDAHGSLPDDGTGRVLGRLRQRRLPGDAAPTRSATRRRIMHRNRCWAASTSTFCRTVCFV